MTGFLLAGLTEEQVEEPAPAPAEPSPSADVPEQPLPRNAANVASTAQYKLLSIMIVTDPRGVAPPLRC